MREISPGDSSRSVTARVTREPIDISGAEMFAGPTDGAVVVFWGVVRDRTAGRSVKGLSYEAYDEMAEEQMVQIGRIAQHEHGAGPVLMVHRTGDLSVGEVSVLVAVAAPHRDAAFGACRFCIDELKRKAAIWKKEIFFDGESRWVEGA